MMVFNLACAHGHAFEGWFSSAENFEKQQTYDLVSCPMCGDAHNDIYRFPLSSLLL
jgi:hypothetical protein